MKPVLDQFYTSRECAAYCFALFEGLGLTDEGTRYVEPSAGDGAFLNLMPQNRRVGFDLVPRHPEVQKRDFLGLHEDSYPMATAVVGNPPFGTRGKLALEFVRKAAEIADTVAFILPLCFRKFALQRRIPEDMRLALQKSLPPDSFRYPDGRRYKVNAEFQVWTRKRGDEDLRVMAPEPKSHPDFEMHQYNNTKGALKMFEREFDFAVPCQGWQNYARKVVDPNECERNKQWMLIKAGSKRALNRLMKIDFGDLANRTGTSVPGFRKCDLVAEYARKHG